jgi:hypothetical protein
MSSIGMNSSQRAIKPDILLADKEGFQCFVREDKLFALKLYENMS